MAAKGGPRLGGLLVRLALALTLAALFVGPAVAAPLATPTIEMQESADDPRPSVLRPAAFDEGRRLREAFLPTTVDLLPKGASVSAASQLPSCEPAGDAGGDTSTAAPLAWPTTCEGVLAKVEGADVEYDLYAISITTPTYLVVTLDVPEGFDLQLCLFSEWESACSTFSGSWDERVEHAVTNGTWWVDTWTYGPNATYTLDIAAGTPPPPQDDCGSGGDASDSGGAPTPLAYPATCIGRIERWDTDVYAVELAAGESFEAHMVPNAFGDFDLCVFGPTREVYDCSFSDGPGLPDRVLVLTDEPGSWTIVVDWWAGSGPYTLDVQPTSPPLPQDDCGTGGDASWRRSSPTPVAIPLECQGTLGDFDAFDWFSIELGEEDHFDLQFSPAEGTQMDVCIATPRAYLSSCGDLYDDAPRSLLGGGEAGRWIIVVYPAGQRGAYELDLVTVERPTQSDCLSGADAGDYEDLATLVTLGTTCTGLAHDLDRRDWYVANVPADSWISATITFDDASPSWVCVYTGLGRCDTDGRAVAQSIHGGEVTFMVYYIGSATGYTIAFEIAPLPPVQSDCGTGRDLEFGSAHDLVNGETCTGLLAQDYGDSYDDYEHEDESAEGLRIRVMSDATVVVCAYDGLGPGDCRSTVNGLLLFDAPYAQLVRVKGDGAYTVTLEGVLRTQSERVPILLGQGLTQEPIASDPNGTFIDGMWTELDQVAIGGESFEARADTRGLLLTDIGRIPGTSVELRFHGADFAELGDACTVTSTWSACDVPHGAAWVFVTAKDGARWDVAFLYHYLDVA